MESKKERKARIADAIVRTYKLTQRDIELLERIDRLVLAYDEVTASECVS